MEFKGTDYYLYKEGFDRIRNNDTYMGSQACNCTTNFNVNFNFSFDGISNLINSLSDTLQNLNINKEPMLKQAISFDD